MLPNNESNNIPLKETEGDFLLKCAQVDLSFNGLLYPSLESNQEI